MRVPLTLCTIFLYLAGGFALPGAAAGNGQESAAGEIGLQSADLSGHLVAYADKDFALRASTSNADQAIWSWTVQSHLGTVNLTHVQIDHYGKSPSGGQASLASSAHEPTYLEFAYEGLLAKSADSAVQREVMVIVSEVRAGEVTSDGRAAVESTKDGKWRIGYGQDDSIGAGKEVGVSHVEALAPRSPNVASEGALDLRVHGNVTMYVWGGPVKASGESSEAQSYRTGTWLQNESATPLHQEGVVREEHAQLLRITATNATLELMMAKGTWEWTQPEIAVALDGIFETPKAEGRLESLTHEYPVEGEKLRMDGRLDLDFRQAQVGDGLRVRVASPSTTIEGPEGFALASDTGVFAAPTAVSLVAGAASLILIAPVAAVFLVGHVRNRRMSTEAHLNRAEEAIVEQRPRVARRHARWLRRKRDGDADVDGWFLHAASLAQQKKYGRILREIPPVLHGVPKAGRASLAFLLIIACQKEDRLEDARRYAAIAVEDPVVRDRVLADPMFADVRDVVPRPKDEPSGLAAYA